MLRTRPLLLLASLAAVATAACSRGNRADDLTPTPNRETIRNLPSWYLKPPRENDYVFGTATATSQDLQVAINKAQADGRLALAQQLEVKYSALTKRFAEEVGRGGDSQLLDQYTQVYKAAVSQVLYGSRARQQAVRPEGPVYRATVLMELPTGEASKRLMEQLRANEQMWTRFRASEAFKELDAEVQRYEAWKKERGIP